MFETILILCITAVVLSAPAYALAFYKACTERKYNDARYSLSAEMNILSSRISNVYDIVSELATKGDD